jgi:hypothetical protein
MIVNENVTLGAQVNGPDAHEPTLRPHYELRRLLKVYCTGPYSPDVDEFAPILRIDGSIHQWKREGCAYLRRSFKERYITVDIFIPISRWKNRSEREIREFFADQVRKALTLCIKRLQKDRTPVDGERLMKDYEKAVKKYLKQVR